MLYHLVSHLSTLGEREREESECVRMRRARERRVTKVSLSHSQGDLVAQTVVVMYQVLYSSSVSSAIAKVI